MDQSGGPLHACEHLRVADYPRILGARPPEIELKHRTVLLTKLMNRYGGYSDIRRYLLQQHGISFADIGKTLLQEGHIEEDRREIVRGLRLCLRETLGLKATWRCVSRLVRFYL